MATTPFTTAAPDQGPQPAAADNDRAGGHVGGHAGGHAADPSADHASWRIRLLGGFALEDGADGTTRLTRLRSRAAMLLLARLALAPARDHPREELAALLWPEADAEAGRSRLRQTLSLLKAVLEPAGAPPVLLADRRALRAAPGALWCDVGAFEHSLRSGRHARARQLYTGELLPGFYDEWVHDERQRLHALADRLESVSDMPPGPNTPSTPSTPSTQQAANAQHKAHAADAPDPSHAQVSPAGLPAGQPPPAEPAPPASTQLSPTAGATRLPQYLTRLIGADQRGARLRALCAEQRLVSIIGPGGCGKTRLALEVARLLSDAPLDSQRAPPRFERAVFVSLVGAVGASELLDRLLQALRIGTAGAPLEQIADLLHGRRLLVLLDNCEQLDDGAVATIATLAERLPAAHWLTTSRRLLGLDGEHEFALAGLALPAPDASLEEAAMNPAVALFVDRARAHRPDFHVGAGNRAGLIGLVRWLEGLPLAIELAASRARSLAPAEMLNLLQGPPDRSAWPGTAGSTGLAWLSRRGPRSGSDARHASMLSVIAWSWALLGSAPQQLLTALCLLPGGATLAAAAALAGSGDASAALPPLQAQQLLDELQGHSVLKRSTGQDGHTRWHPYEPVREYVLAQLAPELARTLRARVLRWTVAWAHSLPTTPPLASVRDELPNLVAVFAAAQADGQADEAVRLVLLLQSAWGEIAIPGSALAALGQLLANPALDPSLAAGGHALAATFAQAVGRVDDAKAHTEQALAQPVADRTIRCMVLSRTARLVWRLHGDKERARALIDEGLVLARELGRFSTEASLLSLQGHIITVADHDPVRAKPLIEQSAELWRRSGNAHLINAGRFNVAYNRIANKQVAAALQEMRALADEGQQLQDWDMAAGALDACGVALRALRQWQAAADAHCAALRVAWDNAETLSVNYALWNVPPVLVRLHEPVLAAETMGAAQALWHQRFGKVTPNDDAREATRVQRLIGVRLPAAAVQAAWDRGAARTMAEAVAAVLAWGRGEV